MYFKFNRANLHCEKNHFAEICEKILVCITLNFIFSLILWGKVSEIKIFCHIYRYNPSIFDNSDQIFSNWQVEKDFLKLLASTKKDFNSFWINFMIWGKPKTQDVSDFLHSNYLKLMQTWQKNLMYTFQSNDSNMFEQRHCFKGVSETK